MDHLLVWAADDRHVDFSYLLVVGNDGANRGSRLTLASLTAMGESSARGRAGLGQKEALSCSQRGSFWSVSCSCESQTSQKRSQVLA